MSTGPLLAAVHGMVPTDLLRATSCLVVFYDDDGEIVGERELPCAVTVDLQPDVAVIEVTGTGPAREPGTGS